MKVKTVRQSGMPVILSKKDEYEVEFKEKFDEIQKEVGMDMKAFHEKLEAVDVELASKYDTIVELNLPDSGKKWKNLIKEYGSVLVSTHKDTGEVMLVIMDQGI